MPSDLTEPRNGVFSRIYSRHEARGGKSRGGRDDDRGKGRDRDRNAARDRKAKGVDPRDEELRIRADTMVIALRKRIEALPDSIDELDDLLRDSLTGSATGMREVPDQLEAKLAKLEDEGSLDDDLLSELALLEGEIIELEQAIALAVREMQSPRVKAALAWAESYLATQLFPSMKEELTALGEALGEGYPVDLPAIARFCEVSEAAKAEADAAVLALATLRTERDTKLPAAKATLAWFESAISRPMAGPVVTAIQLVETAKLDALTAATFPAAARTAIQRNIDALAAWAPVVDNGIRKDKYVKDVLGACNDKFPFVTADKSKPAFESPIAMGDALLTAVLMLPADGPGIVHALVLAKSCPGRWQFFLKQDTAFAEELLKANARDLAIGALSTHLQTGAGWGLGKAPADVLAKQIFAAEPKSLAKLQSSGLTQATWDLLTPEIGYAFETMAGIFVAIDRLINEAAMATLATQRLPYLALSAGNLNTILASGAAQITDERGYPYEPPNYPKTIGASVVIEWIGWMPGGVKARAWGAVHFHFTGLSVASNVTVVHLKDYELHTAGGTGKVSIPRTGAGAQAALLAIRAKNFAL